MKILYTGLLICVAILGEVHEPADLYVYVVENPDPMDRNKFMCKICFKTSTRKDCRDHVENAHFPNSFIYNCQSCGEKLKSKTALKNHKTKYHR